MTVASEHLRAIKTFDDLIPYLEEDLGWPLREYGFDDLTFAYSAAEVGLKDEDAAKVKTIHQLRPLRHGQPWGIFFVEFERKRLPVVVLRRILSHLVIKKRASANRAQAAAWDLHDLLFISAFGNEESAQREMAFAHFHQEDGELPTLRVLGWDGGDTPLKLDHVADTLARRLQWPDDPANDDAWRTQWSGAFRHGQRHVINTADALAERLATLARGIRDAAQTLIAYEADNGPLRQLHNAFRTALIHDLSESDFADTYAQTITYGLLTAAISRTEMSEGRYGTALVSDDVRLMVPITNPFLREMMQTFLQAGGQHGGINFDELGIQDVVELLRGEETDLPAILRDFGNKTQGEDPVIHFYEHFLTAYNKRLKVQRGVFYTPQPAVSYIVRSVHELLQSEFGLADGLADTATWGEMAQRLPDLVIPAGTDPASPFVMILDIATGTATFLVEVIHVIHATMTAKWKAQGLGKEQIAAAWNDYVPRHLLPRLYGYELMMAPYAIAHMKIGLKLSETGYRFGSDERVRVYLTNALEPADDDQKAFQGILPALAHEAQAVNGVKRYVRFTVLVGNPPYSKLSGNRSIQAINLVEPFRYLNGKRVIEKGALALELNLQDDYVKFWGFVYKTIGYTDVGVVSLITNSRYLVSRSLRGLRGSLREQFSWGAFVDLRGQVSERNALSIADENIFEIEQGVAIATLVRRTRHMPLSKVQFAVKAGTSVDKYAFLATSTISQIDQTELVTGPLFRFAKNDNEFREEFDFWPSLDEIMPFNSGGIITSRDNLALDFDIEDLLRKIELFANSPKGDKSIEEELGFSVKAKWNVEACKASIRATRDRKAHIRRVLYRPFDWRWIYYSTDLLDTPSRPVCDSVFERNNLVLLTPGINTTDQFSHALVANVPAEKKSCSHDRATQMFPMEKYDHGLFETKLGNVTIPREIDLAATFFGDAPKASTRDLFSYIYAVLYSVQYRQRYGQSLRDSYPHIPIAIEKQLFDALVKHGGELILLHLLDFALLDEPDAPADWPRYPRLAHFRGGDRTVAKFPSAARAWADGTVAINGSSGFVGVPEEVWNFQVGGYQVCHKWLKDRKGRTLSDEDLLHYAKIVTALHETIRLMEEIDEVIEEHGGWPDAFVTDVEA